jgi:hypothetical protein
MDGKTAVNFNAALYASIYSASLDAAFNGSEGMVSHWLTMNSAASWIDATAYVSFQLLGDAASLVYHNKGTSGYDAGFYTANSVAESILIGQMAGTRWINVLLSWSKTADKFTVFINGTKQRPATTLGTWSGTLGITSKFGSAANNGSKWPGAIQHAIMASAAPSDAQARGVAQTNGQVVFVGDSRSVGTKGWTFPAVDLAYPAGSIGFGGRGVGNWAVAGYTWTQITADAANIDALLISGQSNILVVWAGVNYSPDTTGAQIYARLAAYCTARKAAGWKVVICSEIDCQDAAHNTAGWHVTMWPALNTLIAADHSFAAGYVDLGAIVGLQDATNLTYFIADAVHLTDVGYALVRDAVYPVLAGL